MIKLLVLFLILLAIAIVIGMATIAHQRRLRREASRSETKALSTDYKPEDLTWLYAQGVKPEDIQRSAEQRRLIT